MADAVRRGFEAEEIAVDVIARPFNVESIDTVRGAGYQLCDPTAS